MIEQKNPTEEAATNERSNIRRFLTTVPKHDSNKELDEISGSHGDDYIDDCLLGCGAV
jgi:hypothetical protein